MTDQANDQQPAAMPSPRDLEAALRGAGLSRRQAKRLLSEGIAALEGVLEQDDEPDDTALADQLRKAARALRETK